MREIIIIGGGAAGMMAAISASKEGKKVILLERNEKLGKKLFITGKGRCNITNDCPTEDFLNHVATNSRFLYSAFSHFTNKDMIHFLNEAGLKTKVERGQRVFPESDRSSDVIGMLKRICDRNHVEIRYHAKVEEILFGEDNIISEGNCDGGKQKDIMIKEKQKNRAKDSVSEGRQKSTVSDIVSEKKLKAARN
ncbi:MAG: NAD(P)/FAD-dependent oxidoreductase [Clostridiales bacterium]|nr:NAD(P)/FAD-dependent oxidoreductase [Clostridiales bacterium]